MPAVVRCNEKDKKSIKEFLQKEIDECIESIDDGECIIEESNIGLEVEFPIGEIYGYTSDYVQMIGSVFSLLKEKFPDVGIEGVAYEYETITAGTFGPYFRCEPEDKYLDITYEWQACTECGKIVLEDTFYNSSQWDFEEGNLECICSPSCALLHALSEYCSDLEGNASVDEDTRDELWEDENKIKEILWDMVCDNLDDYIDELKENKERFIPILEKETLTDEQKDVLRKIIED